MTNSIKDQLFKYMTEKENLEKKISEFGEILETNGVEMNGSLIDSEGYPLNDIDIYQVRMARHQIICLQNDYKDLMKRIEQLLHKLHAESRNEEHKELQINNSTEENTSNTNNSKQIIELLKPIVKVNLISAGSPAEDAGLQLDDLIIEFGTINSTNFENDLNRIGSVVRHMENQKITLKVKRGELLLDLILIPKVWSSVSRGLLGCNIILINGD